MIETIADFTKNLQVINCDENMDCDLMLIEKLPIRYNQKTMSPKIHQKIRTVTSIEVPCRRIKQNAARIILLFLTFCFTFTLTNCNSHPSTLSSLSIATPSPTSASTTPETTVSPIEQGEENQVISTPTLAPTATPGIIDQVVEDVSRNAGLDRIIVASLTGENIFSLIISILIVIAGSFVGWWLVNLLVRLAKYTPPSFDDQMIAIIQKQLKWLITLFLIQFTTARLTFLSPELIQWLGLFYYAIVIITIALIILKLIEYGLEGPLAKAATPEQRDILVTFFPLIYRLVQVAIVFTTLAIILQNFGFNLSALLALLGLGGLAVSLAAKETLADMISGFIILIDRPYQIGDRIRIDTMDDWGDVEDIGMRTTRIRTLDNRLVIVPNSVIGRNQVENYTYPDPSIRVEVSVGIGYGSDFKLVKETIEKAVLSVSGISDRENPFVELTEFGDSALIFRVRYWLKSYTDVQLQTTVNNAIYQALTDANIEMPYITYDVNLSYNN
jgi:small-conductance mechanosensitive channel